MLSIIHLNPRGVIRNENVNTLEHLHFNLILAWFLFDMNIHCTTFECLLDWCTININVIDVTCLNGVICVPKFILKPQTCPQKLPKMNAEW